MNIAIIPARKGSKRLKNKNLLRIENNTLIDIAVSSATESHIFDSIILTTDIVSIIKKYKNSDIVINKRPSNLCKDNTTTDKVIKYLIEEYQMKKNDIITILQVTSPLRQKKHIKQAINLYKKIKKPIFSVYEQDIKGKAFNYEKPFKSVKMDKILILNGAIYIFSVKDFIKDNKIPEKFYPYIMDKYLSVDIDNKDDYEVAKLLYKRRYKLS